MRKYTLAAGVVATTLIAAAAATAGTLDDVKSRGELRCGVHTGLTGFGAPDANGAYQGFDVNLCQAVAAAVLGDASKVKYVPTTSETRFTALASGEIEVLIRTSTWTFSRDNDLKLNFVTVNYYDGQGFMVRKDLGVDSVKGLDGATICVQTGTTTELNVADYFRANGITYKPVPIADDAEGQRKYLAGGCDAYTTDASSLASVRASLPNPDDYIVLPEIISKEPLGPVVRDEDGQWADVIAWVYYALVAAEEFGITKANVADMAANSTSPEVRRILGTEGEMGKMLGLDNAWAARAIAVSGNYGEIFDANLGAGSSLKISRGLNDLWSKGGLQYAPPFR